jgi:hypothetical protein
MRALNYDFGGLIKSLSYLVNGSTKSGYNVSMELDKFFSDLKCTSVQYTDNTDNEFFGLYIKNTNMTPRKAVPREGDLDYAPCNYSIEIDSKLASILNPVELTAVIINEIKNIISVQALEKFRDAFDFYIGMNNLSINLELMNNHPNLFRLMYDESVATLLSVFRSPTSDIIAADDFMVGCGLYEEFNSAMDKVKRLKESIFTDELGNKLLTMQWYISVINDSITDTRYISSILRRGFKLTGSKLLRANILNAIKELEPMTDATERYYKSLTEAAGKKSLAMQIKDSGLRAIEQDVYEYTMRIKNIEDENDALLLMRQLNNRIAILEDYIAQEELDERVYQKWNKVLEKYYSLRESLTKKTIYKQKMYGLFADYNVLQQMYMRGELNTVY